MNKMASGDDDGRFLMQIPGDGDTSDDDTVIMGDGDEQTKAGLPDDDSDYPPDVLIDPIPSTSTGRGRGRGRRSRGIRGARGGRRGGGRGNEAIQVNVDDTYDEDILKTYPEYTGKHGPTEIPSTLLQVSTRL